ncbi:MAG: Uma2 family endonuclease [Chloroflexi bacterium]|nr:Uma2 family endonuclease [Chloroflexota bacterium]
MTTNPLAAAQQLRALPPEERDILIRAHYGEELPAGLLIAVDVSLEDYMAHYAAEHCEWVEGFVVKMSPAELRHNDLIYFLHLLLRAHFSLRLLGRVIGQPFVMRLPAFPRRCRQPDLLVVLNTNPHELKETYLSGPADICIEVVSEGRTERDHGEKFREYEKGGVPEYWIIDPIRRESRFYRLNSEGLYTRQSEDANGHYRTPALPSPDAVLEAVNKMLA